MNWIKNYVRPKIRALVGKSDLPDRLWHRCLSCGQMLFASERESSHWVCTHCQHHETLAAEDRLRLLFDEDSYHLIALPETPSDPIRFRDRKRYPDRLREAKAKTGRSNDALLAAYGEIMGIPAVIAAFDFSFMGGSMGIAVGEGFVTAAKLAIERNAAFIAIPSSGGARMQEGVLSLMQMPRTTIAVSLVKEAGLPYIVILTNPTTGGVTASFAMLGDITLAEPRALIGFAGARVIEETIREQLPNGFQRAEYLYDHGMIDLIVPRSELKETLGRILDLLLYRHQPGPSLLSYEKVETDEIEPIWITNKSEYPQDLSEIKPDS